eukprot:Gregarina_sp_Poly_1__8674@NODE_516_length_7810_cov_96_902622_g410_i0_p1_GENE_NODE_516_length_7810_cov_96_902622_g410_i0NODE_516_length_7810_cov_96_902622_g410_i0_p1_ORF_typecomplete_len652_score99_71TPR_19/PF14559_6/0_0062TPR_19/PF14559_6/5_8e06ANAPC3/PF12895_7/12ANAPC3/PF12895_7/5_7e05ANAPC3/PF12895_7/0_00014Fis1_TPR_C/PF14853_6/3_9e03Fis1_TPR_C/PF14853_6/0_052Fis1_TPR_C/PF14853_6/0_0034FKBP_C/PF00254_28/1_5e03FKBP_C/PF00254_28/3_5e06TPR_18/PF13512_6/0_001TPR_15/PF13429_6/0_0014TPR_16/PF13432_6
MALEISEVKCDKKIPPERKIVLQDDDDHRRRHVPGKIYALGQDSTWSKECLCHGKVSIRMKALDSQAVLVSMTILEIQEDQSQAQILSVAGELVDLRQYFGQYETPAVLKKDWGPNVFSALRIICRSMSVYEKCSVDIPVANADIQISKPWRIILELHNHFQAHWPWPVGERKCEIQLSETEKHLIEYRPPQEQEAALLELSEKQAAAQKPWRLKKDSVVSFVGQKRVVSSWRSTRFSRVSVHYKLLLSDTGEVIWDTRKAGAAHHFTIGCGDVVPGLDVAVRQNFTLKQEGFILVSPNAGFGPYDHSLEQQKLFHRAFQDGFAFLDGFESVFDKVVDSRIDRECIEGVQEPNDFDPAGEIKRAENQALREKGLPIDRSNMPRVEIVPDCDPEFLLIPSSVDMHAWVDRCKGRPLMFADLSVVQIKRLPNETSFGDDSLRIKHALRWLGIARRFWKIGDIVRAYQCYYQTTFILNQCHDTGATMKYGEEHEDFSTLKTRSLVNSGICLCRLEEWEEARKVLGPILEKNPDHLKALYWMAKAKFHQEDEMAALVHLKNLLNIDANNSEAKALLRRVSANMNKDRGKLTAVARGFLQERTFAARQTPMPDWSELEEDYDPAFLQHFGIVPTATIEDNPSEAPEEDLPSTAASL